MPYVGHLAEEEGFEPPIRLRMPVFKTGAFNRSATPPRKTELSKPILGAQM